MNKKKSYNQNWIRTLWSRARFFGALLKVKVFRNPAPVIAVIVVNNRCNFRCAYCFGSYSDRRIPDYSTEELKKLIDDLYEMGTRYLNIHGGETLLRSDIGEIVDYIKSKGIYCCLISNGSLLRQRLEEIRNVDNLTISLDGSQENNDKNRGAGSYEAALAALRLAKQENIPLRISATLTRYTMGDIGYMAELAKEMDISLYFSILYKPLPQAREMEMTDPEIRAAMDEILRYKKLGYPVFTSAEAARYARDWPLDHHEHHYATQDELRRFPDHIKPIRCAYSKIKFIIEGDGNVYPCFLQSGAETFPAKNWKEVGLKEAIEHVRRTNTCLTCPALSQNDWNLLLNLNARQIFKVIVEQAMESLKRKGPKKNP